MKRVYNFVTKNQILKKALHNKLELIDTINYRCLKTDFLLEYYYCEENQQYYFIIFTVFPNKDTKFYCAYQYNKKSCILFPDDIICGCRAHKNSVANLFRVVAEDSETLTFYYYD